LNQGNAGKVNPLKNAKAAAAPVGKICQDNEVLENGVCDSNTKKGIVKVRRFQKHLYEVKRLS
jgi:hypothetical protein